MKSIISYSVPNNKDINSGPMVRVSSINKVMSDEFNAQIISGPFYKKITRSIFAHHANILYIESSTNRLKFFDLISLLILRHKVDIVVVFIRDIYIEFFPERYIGFRSKITAFANKLTNIFFIRMSDVMAFPTIRMGHLYCKYNNVINKKIIEMPPACDMSVSSHNESMSIINSDQINIAYIGGIEYKYSGIINFLELIKSSPENFYFFIITQDKSIENIINKLAEFHRRKVELLSLNKNEITNFIKERKLHFIYHPRPLNEYDAITYPIKFFDSLSWNIPFITEPHTPIFNILGNDYPLYVSVNDSNSVITKINVALKSYNSIQKHLYYLLAKNNYRSRIISMLEALS